jgi:hypothetical protein
MSGDTAGAGQSLLDTVLHTRMSGRDGVVFENFTCLALVGRLPAGMPPLEICDFHARVLTEVDPTVTGLLVVQPGSFLGVVESSPECVAALLRRLQASYGASVPMRILGFTEDVPLKRFGPWTFSSVRLPAEPAVDVDAEPGVTALCAATYRTLIHVGRELKASPPPPSASAGAVGGGAAAAANLHISALLQERFAPYLPSDDKVQALALTPKITALDEWLSIFDTRMTLSSFAADAVYPLPPRWGT